MSTSAGLSSYRADIDGLRGIAVLAVVFYHLGIGPTGGGFVGVDIFFVISGFLITSIVQNEIETGRFTFRRFYERRVRRLFPALFATLLLTTLAGMWLLLPSDLVMLGKSGAATLAFASNIFFWISGGYFDTSSEINPLLHTWSLAVEEQFYIGLPILLLLTHRFWPHHLAPVLVVATCVSLAGCLLVQPLRPSAVFYLSPFRAWELLTGALLAVGGVPVIRKRLHCELLSVLGLALIAVGIIYGRPGIDFPGWQAIPPVLGAAILIHAGSSGGSFVQHVLRFRPLVYVGLISYSLYLWHWPLVAFAKYRNGLEPLGEWRWMILAAAFAAAALSYRFVEKPFRRRTGAITPRPLFLGATAAGGVLAATSAIVVAGGGWPARFAPEVLALDKERYPAIPFVECAGDASLLRDRESPCLLGMAGAKPSLLIWGDSHALAWAPAFDNLLRRNGNAAILAVSFYCPPLAGVNSSHNADCLGYNKQVLDYLRKPGAPRTVVMAGAWPKYSNPEGWLALEGVTERKEHEAAFSHLLLKTVRSLHDVGRKVWIIGPTPGVPFDAPLRCAIARMYDDEMPAPKSTRAFRNDASGFFSAVASLRNDQRVVFTDPAPWFCDTDNCAFMKKGLLLYRDDGHLNRRGAAYLEPFLAPVLAVALTSGRHGTTTLQKPPVSSVP